MFKVTSVTPNKIDLPFLTETFIPNIPNTPEPFVKNTRPAILQENPANHVSSDNPQDKCFKPYSYPFLFSIAFINMENEFLTTRMQVLPVPTGTPCTKENKCERICCQNLQHQAFTMYTAGEGSVPPCLTCKTGRVAPNLTGSIRLQFSTKWH